MIYRFEEFPKGYKLELIKRSGWNEEKSGFETLTTVQSIKEENKRGLKAVKNIIDELREKHMYDGRPGIVVGSFDSIIYE